MSNVKSRFQFKLACALLLFAMLISALVATTDHLRMRDQAISNTDKQIELYEISVRNALDTLDKAYAIFGESLTRSMKVVSSELIAKYEADPSFDDWDFQSLKDAYGVDVYIINEANTIVYSSYSPDIGLDFDHCCATLAKILDERRADGGFYQDGVDTQQHSGQLMKYSYQATADKKYIVELGYSLENSPIFREFNFARTVDGILRDNSSINEIHVLNLGGRRLLGSPEAGPTLEGERKRAFDAALATGRTMEYREKTDRETTIYRYVRHESQYDDGATKVKILEIVYNENELNAVLRVNTRMFLLQLLGILVVAAGLSMLIADWVAKPMYLAFHDSLTGLKNRASFEDDIREALAKSHDSPGLLMIDLDNFKIVNDRLGHEAGDRLLRGVAREISSAAGSRGFAYRLGGDEFVMLLPSAAPEEAEAAARLLLSSVRRAIDSEAESYGQELTVSIGIAFAPEHGDDPHALCRSADIALYKSKKLGKNTYHVFEPADDPDAKEPTADS
ncbi:diguanylate cyclase domain-containing protein [Cohnella cellulosilytica]|uniref:Diguanylate cyclase domain-containing protein n=1 Tax=Cohnella cellulosilytica TaxID=986710 RepID=A0ABW2F817_9BACL